MMMVNDQIRPETERAQGGQWIIRMKQEKKEKMGFGGESKKNWAISVDPSQETQSQDDSGFGGFE